MFDIHCHLEYMPAEEVIKEAYSKMSGFITSVADPKDFDSIMKIAEKHENFVFVSAGFHPERIEKYTEREIDDYIEKIRQNEEKIVAIGEVGLDYSWIKEKRNESKEIFEKFISLANEVRKPLVIHCRSDNADKEKTAMNVCLDLLCKAKVPVIMHFFSGTKEQLAEALARNYFISFTTLICKSKSYRKLAKLTPIENMLLETDSPWLDPDNTENKDELTNKPWKIEKSAETIAKEKKIPKEDVLRITEENARKAFSI